MAYKKKPQLSVTEETEDEWLDNFDAYSRDLLKIQTMEGELIPFQMNEIQQLLQEIIKDITKAGRLIRLIVLKARREGVSTWVTARYYWHTSTNVNRYGMIVTHEPEATDFLFNIIKRYHTHNEWKPKDRYNNKKILEFNDEKGEGLDSAIRVGTAGKEDFGSAQLIHFLHLSEVAKWASHISKPLLTSILQCVPDTADSEIIFESTGKGIGGEFYNRYWGARYHYEIYLDKNGKPAFKCTINTKANPDNIYTAIFIPWFVFKKYQAKIVDKDFKRTDEEELEVKAYGLTNHHLQWRRTTIANKCDGDVDVFHQEYPANPMEAFIATGAVCFNTTKCLMLKNSAPNPINKYIISFFNGNFVADAKGQFKVWAEPKVNKQYIVSVDVAEGLAKGDFSCIDVCDQLSGEQVAQWHGKLDADQLALIAYYIARRYNTAYIAVERNNHGGTVINKLVTMKYPKLYVEQVPEGPNKTRKRYGWVSNKATKPEMVDNLIGLFRDDIHGIKCAETFDEMISFKRTPDGEFEAEAGMFDDRVISIAINHIVRQRLPLPNNLLKIDQPGRPDGVSKAQANTNPSPLGWT